MSWWRRIGYLPVRSDPIVVAQTAMAMAVLAMPSSVMTAWSFILVILAGPVVAGKTAAADEFDRVRESNGERTYATRYG